MTAPNEPRDAVARTINEAIMAEGPAWSDAEIADAILSEHIAPRDAEIERLRTALAKATETWTDDKGGVWAPIPAWSYFAACHKFRSELVTLREQLAAAEARAEEAEKRHDGRFWLVLHEPKCVPEQKGPWPLKMLKTVLREFMAARPQAYITVATVDYAGPMLQHGPEVLQMADARSMGRGRKHNAQTRAAHGDHVDAVLAAHSVTLTELAETKAALSGERVRVAGIVDKTLTEWTRPSAVRLMVGEMMSAQEARTADAVAKAIAAKIRLALTPEQPHDA